MFLHRKIRATAVIAVGVLMLAPSVEAQADRSLPCSVSLVEERELRTDSESLYIEPEVMLRAADGSLLLLGYYNHAFHRGGQGWVRETSDSLMGVLLGPGGADSLVHITAPYSRSEVARPRAVAWPDGSWSVLLPVKTEPSPDPVSDSLAAIWHGIWRDGHWVVSEEVPLPSGRVKARSIPRPQLAGTGELVWPLIFNQPGRPGQVLLMKRSIGGSWSAEVVPSVGAVEASAGSSDGSRLDLLAIIAPDPEAVRDANSLFLWRKEDAGWQRVRGILTPGTDRFNRPRLLADADVLGILWKRVRFEEAEPRYAALWTRLTDPESEPLEVDPSITSPSALLAYAVSADRVVVTTDHVDSTGNHRSIRFTTVGAAGIEGVQDFPHEFVTDVALSGDARGGVIATGGIAAADNTHVTSRLLRFASPCFR